MFPKISIGRINQVAGRLPRMVRARQHITSTPHHFLLLWPLGISIDAVSSVQHAFSNDSRMSPSLSSSLLEEQTVFGRKQHAASCCLLVGLVAHASQGVSTMPTHRSSLISELKKPSCADWPRYGYGSKPVKTS